MATPPVTPQTPSASANGQTLAQMVRGKYPGTYDDMDDPTLESKILAKYPQYGDVPRTTPQTLPKSTAEIRSAPTGALPWLKNLESDVRYGTGNTAPGRALQFLGAKGTNVGESAGAADTVASPILGPIHAAQGVAQLPSHPWEGAKKIAGGALEAATLPGAFLGGPTAAKAIPEMADQAGASIYKNLPFLGKAFASKARAGENFQQVMGAAKDVPVNFDTAQDSILKMMDWQGKTQLGPTINKFLNRITNAGKGPVTYGEARDWYTLLGKISSDEMSKLPPVVQRELGSMVGSLKQDIGAAAGAVGKESQYGQAMQEFSSASRRNEGLKTAAKAAVKYAAPAAAAGYIGKKIEGRR